MAFDEGLAERIREQLGRVKNVEEKRMFSGLAFLLGGNLLVGVRKDELLARVGPEQAPGALRQPHVRVFAITGRVMTGWVLIAPEGIEEDHQLAEWIGQARAFVEGLPAK